MKDPILKMERQAFLFIHTYVQYAILSYRPLEAVASISTSTSVFVCYNYMRDSFGTQITLDLHD